MTPLASNPAVPGRLLAIFPHPDDEAFSCGGVMAGARDLGAPVTLICLTRGEAGQTRIAGLDPDILGSVREEELRAAMTALDVTDVRLLDYRDSGMPGTPENAEPRALVNAPLAVIATRLAIHIRALKPAAVITFGPDGAYGHGDHIAAHFAVLKAVEYAAEVSFRPELGQAWSPAAIYESATPRDEMQAIIERNPQMMEELPPETIAAMGRPRNEIDVWIDVRPWADQKLAALTAHQTQFDLEKMSSELSPEQIQRWTARESFVRIPLTESAGGGADVVTLLATAHPLPNAD